MFEILTVLAGVLALFAVLYGSVVVDRIRVMGNLLIACGAISLLVVPTSWITFEIADPLGSATGGHARLGPGAILAALSAGAVLTGGLLVHFRR